MELSGQREQSPSPPSLTHGNVLYLTDLDLGAVGSACPFTLVMVVSSAVALSSLTVVLVSREAVDALRFNALAMFSISITWGCGAKLVASPDTGTGDGAGAGVAAGSSDAKLVVIAAMLFVAPKFGTPNVVVV